MSKTRKQNSRHFPHPHFSAATARAITEFAPTSATKNELIAVEVIDWGIVVVVRITALMPIPLSVEKVTVDYDFIPVLAVNDDTGVFELLEWPQCLCYGRSLNAVVQAPLAGAKTLNYCYPCLPRKISVSIESEVFRFAAGQTVLQGD